MHNYQRILLCTGSLNAKEIVEYIGNNQNVMLWFFEHSSNKEVGEIVNGINVEYRDIEARFSYIFNQIAGVHVPDPIVEEFSELPTEICGQNIDLPYESVAPINLLLLISVLSSLNENKEGFQNGEVGIVWFIKGVIPQGLHGLLAKISNLFPEIKVKIEILPVPA